MRTFKINVNGVAYNVEVEEIGGAPAITTAAPVAAAPVAAPAAAPVQAPAAPKAAAPANGAPVKAPMPGMIVKILVKNGDAVKVGQPILVLEAMKMENDIVADKDGIVNIAVSQGASVNTGDVLATIA